MLPDHLEYLCHVVRLRSKKNHPVKPMPGTCAKFGDGRIREEEILSVKKSDFITTMLLPGQSNKEHSLFSRVKSSTKPWNYIAIDLHTARTDHKLRCWAVRQWCNRKKVVGIWKVSVKEL